MTIPNARGRPVDPAGQLPTTEPLRPDDPRHLGDYDLLGVLGEGGMGRVYLGRSAAGRLVAVKVIRAELARDEAYRRRFRSEVELAKRVPPYATAEVLDADPDHLPPYLVVEYVDGPSLGDMVRRNGPLSAANLHSIAMGVATALQAIHDANVIHRDLKPSNILMPHGVVKVIDFGIARPALDPHSLTGAGNVLGTIPYMAPERLHASGRRTVTSAADIFSWGAVVVFAGTGRDAFASDSTADVIGRILTGMPDLTGLTEPLLSLVRLALAKDPRERPTARDLMDSLMQVDNAVGPPAEHSPIAAANPSTDPVAPPADLAPAPHQVSAPSRWFVGRVSELTDLTDALCLGGARTGVVPVAAIVGVGGLGKTWLVTRWVQDNLARFPDGQLYVNLRGHEPGSDAVPPAVALGGFLDALGVEPAAVPDDADACAALYRDLVACRRMVVVLDNAADSAQAMPLLPGSPSVVVLVTSRRHLGGLTAVQRTFTLELDVLSTADARLLLVRRLGANKVRAEPAAVDAVIERCAGRPLALSIVAAVATAHRDVGLIALAENLRQGHDDQGSADAGSALRAVLATAYRHLPPELARSFRLLGAAPGPEIGLPAAASVLGLPVRLAGRHLRYLMRTELLQEHGPGRFRMHDLVRQFAVACAGTDGRPGESSDAVLRLIDFYVRTAVAGDHLLCPFRPPIEVGRSMSGQAQHRLRDRIGAYEWFTTNTACLLAVQRVAAREGWHRAVWQLARSLTTFQWRRGQMAHHVEVWQAGLAAAEGMGDLPAQAEAHRLLGYVHKKAGRQAQALDHLNHALALSRQSGDSFGMAHTHLLLAGIAETLGDTQTALAHGADALNIARTLHNPVWKGIALEAVGSYHARLGNFDNARGSCEEALNLHREHGHREGEALALRILGDIEQGTWRSQQAQRAYSDALALYRDLGDTHAEATVLERLGEAYRTTGDDSAAHLAWEEALSLYQRQFRMGAATALKEKLAALRSYTP